MSPEAARLFFGCSIGFLLGGAAGAFGTRTLYGEGMRVDPAPTALVRCPEPPPCAACPDLERAEPSELSIDALPDDGPPPIPLPPGIPPSVIPNVRAAVDAELQALLSEDGPCGAGLAGSTIVLQLSVVVEADEGAVEEASVVSTLATAEETDNDCRLRLAEVAERARFDGTGRDGRLQFKVPIVLGEP